MEQTVSQRGRVRKTVVYDVDSSHSSAKSEEEKEEKEEEFISEDEFKPEKEVSEEEESNSSSLFSEKDSCQSVDESDLSICELPMEKPRRGKSKRPDDSLVEAQSNAIVLEEFNAEEVIEVWNYELDQETNMFTKPIIPLLSDAAIKPYLSKNSKPKCVIYNCPFCERVFTYTLVFKSHLYSCEKNTNVPD